MKAVVRRVLVALLAVTATFVGIVPVMGQAERSAAAATADDITQQLAVPAYIDPGTHPAEWRTLTSAAPGTLGIVVANPDSGPGPGPVAAWTTAIHRARAHGATVLGYVDTGYLGSAVADNPDGLATRSGQRGLAAWQTQIESDIATWYAAYGTDLGGVFFDRATRKCGPGTAPGSYVKLYQALGTWLKTQHPGALVALNPGIAVPRCYQSAADVLVTFEGSYTDYSGRNYHGLRWRPGGGAVVWHIVYGAGSKADERRALELSRRREATYVYVTNEQPPNPYDALPPAAYWSDEQAQIAGRLAARQAAVIPP